MHNYKVMLAFLFLLSVPAISCVAASQVAVRYAEADANIPAPAPVETAVETAQALRDLGELLIDMNTVVEITPYTVLGGEVAHGTHATTKHAEQAAAARGALSQSGTECHECEDGRRRCWNTSGGQYALGVYQMIGDVLVEITVFLCDETYLEQVLDECDGSGFPNEKYAG